MSVQNIKKMKNCVIFLDSNCDLQNKLERSFSDTSWEYVTAITESEMLKVFESHIVQVVAVADRFSGGMGIEVLKKISATHPEICRIGISTQDTKNDLHRFINQCHCYRVIQLNESATFIQNVLEGALEFFQQTNQHKQMYLALKKQNNELEQLTSNLENTVENRTQVERHSKQILESQVQRMRSLVRFVKDLSYTVGLEELLLQIRAEAKTFHRVYLPILFYSFSPSDKRCVYFMGNEVAQKNVAANWSNGQIVRINELADQQILANVFGRPFGRTIAIPLNTAKVEGTRSFAPTLFFENSLQDDEIDDFVEFISERLQPVSITLQRILSQMEMVNTTYLWEKTFDGITDPIAIIDHEYNVIRNNRAFLNYGKSDNAHCFKLFNDGEEVCNGCEHKRSLLQKEKQVGRVKMKKRIFEVHSYPILFQDSEYVSSAVNYYRDITQAQELQGHVIQNEKIAAIGHLAGNIAHELNNPLTGIRSLCQVLLSEHDSQEQFYKDVHEVESAAQRSQSIIRNLLDFSRGEVRGTQGKVSLNEIVNKTIPLLKTAMGPFVREMELIADPDMVKLDPEIMRQVVFNLITNACQAMKDKGSLGIRTYNKEYLGKSWVVLEIKDSGPGIPKEQIEQIFEPFYTTKSAGEGTGLGLSMCKKFVSRYGGKIEVDSEEGVGTSFRVWLPAGN